MNKKIIGLALMMLAMPIVLAQQYGVPEPPMYCKIPLIGNIITAVGGCAPAECLLGDFQPCVVNGMQGRKYCETTGRWGKCITQPTIVTTTTPITPKPECTVDSDCPQIYCIMAPCPVNKCINGKCTVQQPTKDCRATGCPTGYVCKQVVPDYRLADGTVKPCGGLSMFCVIPPGEVFWECVPEQVTTTIPQQGCGSDTIVTINRATYCVESWLGSWILELVKHYGRTAPI